MPTIIHIANQDEVGDAISVLMAYGEVVQTKEIMPGIEAALITGKRTHPGIMCETYDINHLDQVLGPSTIPQEWVIAVAEIDYDIAMSVLEKAGFVVAPENEDDLRKWAERRRQVEAERQQGS